VRFDYLITLLIEIPRYPFSKYAFTAHNQLALMLLQVNATLFQLYQFRKWPLPPPDDEEQEAEVAAKLMKYSVSLPAYVSAIEDVNNPW